MHPTQVMAEMIDIANANWALSPDDAIAHLAVLIDGMDLSEPTHDAEVEMLLRVGACIWKLQQGRAG